MYRVAIENLETKEIENFIANDLKEVRAIVTLAPDNNYDVLLVEKMDATYAKDFLDKIITPEGMVTGVGEAKITEIKKEKKC